MFNRLIPIIAPCLIFIGFELFFLKPVILYFIVLFFLIISGAATWKIIGKGLITVRTRWLYLLTPVTFLISALIFILFLEHPWVKHLIALSVSIFFGIFLENIFTYIYRHEKYQINSLENISNYLNLTSFFLFNSSLFGFFIFLNLPFWPLSFISLAFSFLLTIQTIWVNKIDFRMALLNIFVICLILFELFWSISFLPTFFYINGLILATIFYLMNNLFKLHLLGNLNKKVLRRYFILCGFIIILVLTTAKWT